MEGMHRKREVMWLTLPPVKLQDTTAITAKPAETLPERINLMGSSLSEFAEMLDPTDSLSDVFPTQPSKKHVQIVVKFTGM